jgi:hypothetical protein
MMYLFETGFGEIDEPQRQGRRCTLFPEEKRGACAIELKVKFRRSFEDFLREVENALLQRIEPLPFLRATRRRTVRRLMYTQQMKLQLKTECHQRLLDKGVKDNDALIVKLIISISLSTGVAQAVSATVDSCWRLIDL